MSDHMKDQWLDRLSDYLDGELSEGERVALEAHLQTCGDCAELLAELRAVVARARTLTPLPPRRDLWPGIAQRIGATAGGSRPIELASRRRWSFSIPQLAAAAIALMTVSGSAVWLLRSPAPANLSLPVATAPVSTTPVITPAASGRGSARQSYAQAVADLERVLTSGRGQLDTTTIRIIEQNLAAIDQAIAQAQSALDADPANLYLNSHLNETMRRKLELLRQAAALVPVS
ncbi:MAG: anti-sigma factor family protein [Gemmatimonadales bacterium]